VSIGKKMDITINHYRVIRNIFIGSQGLIDCLNNIKSREDFNIEFSVVQADNADEIKKETKKNIIALIADINLHLTEENIKNEEKELKFGMTTLFVITSQDIVDNETIKDKALDLCYPYLRTIIVSLLNSFNITIEDLPF